MLVCNTRVNGYFYPYWLYSGEMVYLMKACQSYRHLEEYTALSVSKAHNASFEILKNKQSKISPNVID